MDVIVQSKRCELATDHLIWPHGTIKWDILFLLFRLKKDFKTLNDLPKLIQLPNRRNNHLY